MEKLNEGWLLSGDIGADARFSLINPGQTRADLVPGIEVDIVGNCIRREFLYRPLCQAHCGAAGQDVLCGFEISYPRKFLISSVFS